jgi:branched-subunit amino acid transport protein
MNIWIIMVVLGTLTFLTRFSFILLLEKINLPRPLQRTLRFVPIAVLSAIIAPELLFTNGSFITTLANPRLLAGLVATLVAFRTRNVLVTIAAGMAAFWILKIWL